MCARHCMKSFHSQLHLIWFSQQPSELDTTIFQKRRLGYSTETALIFHRGCEVGVHAWDLDCMCFWVLGGLFFFF